MPDGICPFAQVKLVDANYATGYIDRVGFCDHAAGGFYTTLTDPNFWKGAGVLVHFAIGRKANQITQLCNIFNSPFAQGRLGPTVSWPYYDNPNKPYRRANPNYLLISTEHEDWELVNGVARAIPGSQWTPEQYESSLRVKEWCIEEVRRVKGLDLMQYEIDSLTGHYMFDSVNRANCPGLYWARDYRQNLYLDIDGEDEMYVPHNTWATKGIWGGQGLKIAPGATIELNAQYDFDIPENAIGADIEFMAKTGYTIVKHGNGYDAGRVGWGVPIGNASLAHFRVNFTAQSSQGIPGRWFKMFAEDVANPPEFYSAHCTGYYT